MSKLAIIRTGGKQYLVKENDKLKIEKLVAEAGQKVELETLLVADGDQVEVGTPVLATKVSGTVARQLKDKKVTGVQYKRKTRQLTRFGHRQLLSEVVIEKI